MSAEEGRPTPKILVVDDQKANIDLMMLFLAPKGYEVSAARSGPEALEILKTDPADVIILDLVMPEMNGFEVCERIKHQPETRHIPVIMISGTRDPEPNVKALEAGADDFLQRPFNAVFLDARIRSCIRTKMLQDRIINYQRQLEGQNEILEERIRERTAQLARTQQVSVFTLAKLAESRDPETGQHLDRIRNYAREVTRELASWPKYTKQIDDAFIHQIYESSPLHDIGKVGIPDRILLKPGKLTEEEFEIMKTHTTIGGETLRAADKEAGEGSFLSMGVKVAFSHHEKWNGKGYPEGLAGEDIPLAARIVAIADVYDALATKRPYKEAFPHEKVRGIIVGDRGTHFDPDIVDAFLAREMHFIAIAETMCDPTTKDTTSSWSIEATEEQWS